MLVCCLFLGFSSIYNLISCHPSVNFWKDELGVEGVIILQDCDEKRVRIGSRNATSKVKVSEYEDSKAMSAGFERQAIQVDANTKDRQTDTYTGYMVHSTQHTRTVTLCIL